ncbi:MAG: hypothetical protein HOV81_26325 [Kofleriaceae bacterium]|nr:hypothetical protein [Kofleriaceae bacterium]
MTLRAIIVGAIVLAAPREAACWRMAEHRAIGTESYIAACERLAASKDRDAGTTQRYEVACGNLGTTAFLYGQGTSVSGDFVSEPGELLSVLGASTATSRTNYYKLALTNGAHFHPTATREWREIHKDAVDGALAASREVGVEQLQAFEQAFAESAFADHFLHDSFAAGHMGFDRPGSSVAASKAFHDEWNERGRRVANRRGQIWITYGDGYLDIPQNRDARRRVVAASAESVYGVVAAFVLGTRDPEPDYEVWREVPFAIDDQELLPTFESLFRGSEVLTRPTMLPLLAVKRRAEKDGILGAWSSFTMGFEDADHPIGAIVFGGDLLLPGLGTRIEVGAGIGLEDSARHVRFAVDGGFVKGIALSFSGLVSHEIDAGVLLVAGTDDVDVVPRITYRLNVEAGDWLVRPEIGPAYDVSSAELGFYVGIGIMKVLSASGGGGFY